jgi:carbon-monoxide dehydrogenase medium subunit
MIPSPFEYHAPATLDEALELLARHGDDAKILSGGQSLLPLMKLRLAAPAHIVDINRIPGLAFLERADGVLRVGALVREADLEESEIVRSALPILSDTARQIADPLVRNLATLCGNLAHGDPANDHPATMLALGAEVVATGRQGSRRIAVSGFCTGPFVTALRADEILTEIRIPLPPPRSGGVYLKVERKVGDYATAGVAVQLTLGPQGTCERIGIGLTNVGPTPIKAERAEAALRGRAPTADAIKEVARLVAEAAEPSADLRGSVEYKRDLVRVLTARALRKAVARA